MTELGTDERISDLKSNTLFHYAALALFKP